MTKLTFKKTYSPLSSDEIIAKEKANMDKKRFEHCVRVSETARKLAKLNHYDEDKAALAGFVHDYAKQVPVEEYRKVIKEQDFDKDLLNWNRAIWHGIVGIYFIEHDLKIRDPEILTAVRRQIVFMADFIEPGRDFPGVDEARKITYANIDEGVGYQLAHTLEFLVEKRNRIYPRTIAAYNVWSTK